MYLFGFYCKTTNINWVHSVLPVVVLSCDNGAELDSVDKRADEGGDTFDVWAKVDPKLDGDTDVRADVDSVVDVPDGNSVTTTLNMVKQL